MLTFSLYVGIFFRSAKCFAFAFAFALVWLAAPATAHAQAYPLPPSPPPPPSARAAGGEYVAPLQQQTQPSYLPQSVALSGPPIIEEYRQGAPVPLGYHADTRVRRGLIIGGAVPLGVLYTLTMLTAAGMSEAGAGGEVLYVPVLGPFLQMASTSSQTGNSVLLLDGLGQAAGAAMLIAGLAWPKTILVRNDLGHVRVTPMPVGSSGGGLSLVGTFLPPLRSRVGQGLFAPSPPGVLFV
ncbi:MAG TPA: hypothetical protein VFS00_28450 [Polyangiaceae bacterium]|nr:hypothetical protein [Polyangiaceae bacterium]